MKKRFAIQLVAACVLATGAAGTLGLAQQQHRAARLCGAARLASHFPTPMTSNAPRPDAR